MTKQSPPFSRAFPFDCRRGFSLIELLATIGIVALLASVAIPTLSKMQEKGHSAKCVSNLKQWGAVTMAYVADHDGALPCNNPDDADGHTIWYAVLWPYVFPESGISPDVPPTPGYFPPEWKRTIFECPNMMKTDPKTSAYRSYGFNLSAGDNKTSSPDKLASILRPASTAMIGEAKASNALGITTITARHDGNCNVVYMDGHVGSVKPDTKLTTNYQDAFWGQTKFESKW